MLWWAARTRTGRMALAALGAVAAWHAWLEVQAAAKVPPDLRVYVSPRGTIDLRVTLRFPPERFHVLMFQKFGRVSGTEDDSVEVRSVPVGRVREIARFYWVRRITPLRE
jgi:hypothetical protein